MTEYFCLKCGSKLVEEPDGADFPSDASIPVKYSRYNYVFKCSKCGFEVGIDTAEDWKE